MRESAGNQHIVALARLLTLPIFVFILAVSCSDSTGPDDGSSEGQFTRDSIGADGGTLEVTASDGATCQLTIPAGSLADTTPIKITAETSSSVSDLGPISNDFILEPDGLEFIEPVTITITIPNEIPADRVPAILLTGDEGPGILLETQVEGQTLSASLEHFSSATAVAWTEEALVDYWDLITYYIERDGLDPISVENLFRVYYSVYDNPDVFPTIDLSLWYDELRELTNDLILKGSLLCSSGNCNDGNECLTLASKICMILYDDLADWALQEYDNCCAAGTIVIDQSPDNLSGAGWTLSGPRNETGSGDMTLTDMPAGSYALVWDEVSSYTRPPSSVKRLSVDETITFNGLYTQDSGPPITGVWVRVSDVTGKAEVYVNDILFEITLWGDDPAGGYNGQRPGDSYWKDANPLIQEGDNTFRFLLVPQAKYGSKSSATFEVWVDGVQVITRSFATQDINETIEETVTLSF